MRSIKKIYYILLILGVYTTNLYASSPSDGQHTLYGARIIPSGGSAGSLNYLIEDVNIGGIFGGTAESQNYSLRAGLFLSEDFKPILAILVEPDNWHLDTVKVGEPYINLGNEITVTNVGNVITTLGLRVTDTTGKKWEAGTSPGDVGLNRYVISGIFTGMDVMSVGGDDFGSEDIIPEFDFVLSENGAGVMPDDARKLWLKFEAPTADCPEDVESYLEHIQHNLCVEIEAYVSQ